MKTQILTVIILVVITMVGLATAQPPPDVPTGAVMATDSTGNPDAELYPGTAIYIVGHTLLEGAPFRWEIYDMDAGCGGNPLPGPVGCGTLVSSGSGGTVNADGTISPPFPTGWNLPEPDYNGHAYKLIVEISTGTAQQPFTTFYTKVDSFDPIPEIATAGLVTVGLFGLVMLRKYRK